VDGADDQLWAVDVVQRPSGLLGAGLKPGQRHIVVLRRDAVVQHRAIGDLTGHLHHLGPGRADHDLHVARLAAPVNDVEFDTVDVVELAVEGDALQRQQAA
jgi:hypothetical protein